MEATVAGKMVETGGFLLELGTVLARTFFWGEGIKDPSQNRGMGSRTHPGMGQWSWDSPGWSRTSGNLQRQRPTWPCGMELRQDHL